MIAGKRVPSVGSLQRHLKHSIKQLQLSQSVAGITASQLLAVAALMDSAAADEVDCGGLLSVAVASHHTSGLTWRAGWRHSSSPVFLFTVKPLITIAKEMIATSYLVRLRMLCCLGVSALDRQMF